MYAYLRGNVEYKGKDYIVLDVNNIGYNIYMAALEVEEIKINENIKIYTYLNIKENEMTLHGFLTQEKLSVFKKLIEVSGVGPKAGKTIMSQMSPEDVCLAIATSDVKSLTKISGVGPKMAQRIILELKDKITNEQVIDKTIEQISITSIAESKEAVIALQVLGYSQKQSEEAVKYALETEEKLEAIIKKSLKFLATR